MMREILSLETFKPGEVTAMWEILTPWDHAAVILLRKETGYVY
jgi:fructose-1,6-bisphosphatase/inositol monophosphatase family enzyme